MSSSMAVVEIRRGQLLLRLELAAELLVLALEPLVAAELVDGAVLGGRHEPGARVVRDADSGHCSSAATSASWASSSARPTSRTIRASPAISRADSIRQTASIVRWISGGPCRLPRG